VPGAPADEDRRARRRRLGHGPGVLPRRATPRRAAVGARCRAGRSDAARPRCNRPLPARGGLPDGLRIDGRPARRWPMPRPACSSSPRRWPACAACCGLPAGSRRCGCARASRPAAACWATRSRASLRRACPAACCRAQLRARGGARPAHGAGGGQHRRRTGRVTVEACTAMPARLHQPPTRRRRGRRRGEERAGHRHRHARRHGPGPEAGGAERARRADHARPGRDDAPGRGAGRARRDLHGPVGPGRPGAHRHRRPVAQPQGRPAAGAGQRWPRCWPRWAMWPKASTAPHRGRARAALGVEMPITAGGGRGAGGPLRRRRRWRS
jgi:hypothetical protein